MTRVMACITQEHDFRLLALALLICLLGSGATIQLARRTRSATVPNHIAWILLAGVGTGTMVWSTHFVAMMAFRTDAPVVLDTLETILSLVVAIVVAAPGLALAVYRRPWAAAAGGSIVGLAIAAMHYLGMSAYRIDGIVTWDWHYVVASVALSVILSAAAFHVFARRLVWGNPAAAALLGLAVLALHFTGMAAMSITVMNLGGGMSETAMAALAVATAGAALLFIAWAAVSGLIDSQTKRENFRRLRHMALRDGLTDLPNRMSFNEELSHRLALEGGYPYMAVFVLDLSRFKAINDTYGHQTGDQLLKAVAARLSAMLEPGEYISRLGGDEFAALLSYEERDALDDFTMRLTGVFAAPFELVRLQASIAANIGIALASRGGDADALLEQADLAMYRAKLAHSAKPCFYDAQMDEGVRARRELTGDLRDAINAGAFELHFQVQAAVGTSEITGYEALARWRHPTLGDISPAVFIPLAEQTGAIVALSIWILRQACFEAALWPKQHIVAVNLSPMHLADPDLVDTVKTALADSGLPPERLALELTESAIIHDRAVALKQLRALHAMGITIALDDFGIGYSSLDVLRSFPFDMIKLDASFVADIDKNAHAVLILRSVAALGHSLDMLVVAEGIERPAQLAIVAREGCTVVQGYLIGRPSRLLADPARVRWAMRLGPRPIEPATAAA